MPTSQSMTIDLAREQAFLDHARDQLTRMRERTLALDINAGDAVAAERLATTLWERARSLTEDGHTALFFGRLDVEAAHPAAEGRPAQSHVG